MSGNNIRGLLLALIITIGLFAGYTCKQEVSAWTKDKQTALALIIGEQN